MGVELTDEHHRKVPNMEVKDMTAGYGGIVNGEPAVTILRDVNVKVEQRARGRGHRRVRLRQVDTCQGDGGDAAASQR